MHRNTPSILQQLLALLPRDWFESFVGQHHGDKYVKKLTCWGQLTLLMYAQITGKKSLRDIETGLTIEHRRWYHLGITTVAKSTLARANEKRPYEIYESLFYQLLKKCQSLVPGTASFSFKNALYAVDSSTIELCLQLFPWAHFKTAKGALKLHTLFNVRSQIPECVILTDGKVADVTIAQWMDFSQYPKGSIFVFDRGYVDYALLSALTKAGHHFVIRRKKNANVFTIQKKNRTRLERGVRGDEVIAFTTEQATEDYPDDLRLVTYYDETTKTTYEFMTDEFRLSACNIALIYKHRWQIELFFKWIKQHLKIKTFLGTSKNAVMTQIWVAMTYYLLVAWLKFQSKSKQSMHTLTVMLKEVCLQLVQLIDLLHLKPNNLLRALARASPQPSLF